MRYVFDIDPDIGPDELPEPLIDITFDANGTPSVKLPEQKNTEGVTVTVLATEDLTDWSNAKLVPMAYDKVDDTYKPTNGVYPNQMFYKWRLDFINGDEE